MAESQNLKGDPLTEPWYYDLAIENADEALDRSKEVYRVSLSKLRMIEKTLRGSKKRRIPDSELHRLTNDRSMLIRSIRWIEKVIKDEHRYKTTINSSRPFLVGPATLDSLINERPKSFEYLARGRIPFDQMFFNFSDPFQVNIPFTQATANMVGVLFSKGNIAFPSSRVILPGTTQSPKNDGSMGHSLTVYTADEKGDDVFRSISILFNNPSYSENFLMYCRNAFTHRGVGFDQHIRVDPASQSARLINFSQGHNPTDFDESDVFRRLEEGEADKVFHLDEIQNGRLFNQLSYLCVNLVNYINAHNVTVVQKNRGKYTPYEGENIDNLHYRKKPFHIVAVRDDLIDELQEKEARSWTLKWRLYVRGHDRRFRDENGRIIRTSWVQPHIRGPPSAPWREQRYQVLADKLEREKQMYSK